MDKKQKEGKEQTNGGIFVTYFANYCTNLDAHLSITSDETSLLLTYLPGDLHCTAQRMVVGMMFSSCRSAVGEGTLKN